MGDSQGATAVIRKLFYGVPPADLAALRALATPRRYPAGTVLCHQGEIEHVFYIVHEGVAAVSQKLPDGEERVLDLRRPGEFFGEIALLDNSPRMATVYAATPLAVLEFTEEAFIAVLQSVPAAAMTVLRQVMRSFRDNDRRAIDDLQAKNAQLARAYEELQCAQAKLVEREVMRHELETAAEVQRGLLPREIAPFKGFEFAGYNAPAHQVGGDLYDVLWIDDDHVGLLLADVCDKGVQAALYMAITKALFLTWSLHTHSPGEVAQHVHRGLMDVGYRNQAFVTAFYGVLDCTTRELRYVRAGQERPLWLRAGQARPAVLPGEGRFLGLWQELALEEYTVTLAAGDCLLLYSDGVPDALNPAEEPYGRERLGDLLAGLHVRRPADILRAVLADVRAFQGDAPPADDLTVLAVGAPDADGVAG